MNISRTLIAASGVLVASLIVVAATGDNHVGCGILPVSQNVPDGEAAILEFRIDGMTDQFITVNRRAPEDPSVPSTVRTRSSYMGANATCRGFGGINAHFVIESSGPSPEATFLGEGPVRVVIIGAGIELASATMGAGHDSEIKLTW